MHKILLLEDDLSLIDGLTYSLKKQGFDVDIVRTVQAAMETWQDGRYDLLILDVSLPDGSGFDVCKRIRQVSKVPIIFLTASDEEVSVVMGLDMGGDDYITKPLSWASSYQGSTPFSGARRIFGMNRQSLPPVASRYTCFRAKHISWILRWI